MNEYEGRVYTHLMGDELRMGYKSLIDVVATWLVPSTDMMKSRNETEKQILQYVTETFKPYNESELKLLQNWMQEIPAFLEHKERKAL